MYSFMDKKFASNNIENQEFTSNADDTDYESLITRLKEISANIALLEKIILK